ncbi:MAG TPA: SCP2 sterol-binding domain-containing protein [Gammaproteobacteria bacterium]
MSFGLLERIERLLERGVRESSSAAQRAAELEGAALRIEVDGLGVDVVLSVDGGRIRIVRDDALAADATVRGTPLDLLRVSAAGRASRLPGSGVTLTGRVHVVERFAELLRIALPDPEEELSRWVGDVVAHQAGSAARAAGAWAARAFDALTADTAEYLTEEGRLLPTRAEADALFDDIERLRDDVERIEARIEILRTRARREPACAGVETS